MARKRISASRQATTALLAAALVLATRVRATTAWPALHFTASRTFQIAIFEDLHFGEAEDTTWGPQQDAATLGVMRSVLAAEAPQLVVLNGDLIAGENTMRENATDYVDVLVKPVVDAGLPWASTYGNHDSDFNLSRFDVYAREKTYANSLTGNAVSANDSGVSNYYLPVYASQDAAGAPALLLWFFDSRGGNFYQELKPDGSSVSIPNWVGNSTVSWFVETRNTLAATYGAAIPSLAFVHIPVDAFLAFQSASGGVDAHTAPGINEDVPLSQQGVQAGNGPSRTVYTYAGQDAPFMQALQDTEGLIGVFSGHDHGNDWCFKWDAQRQGNGAKLCFGRHTGYGGYGNWTRGARQVLVSLDKLGNGTETWSRLEDGGVVGRVTLNETYGEDVYPVVPLTYTGLPE